MRIKSKRLILILLVLSFTLLASVPAFNYLTVPVDVSPGKAGPWVDVSSYVPKDTTGVTLQVVSTDTDREYGVRKNGSTDTWMLGDYTAKGDCHTWLMTGLNANRIFEVYTEDTGVTIYLIGYTGELSAVIRV